MKDMIRHMDKLRADAAEFRLISDLAIDKAKRDLFAKLSDHLNVLAMEVQRAIAKLNGMSRPPEGAGHKIDMAEAESRVRS